MNFSRRRKWGGKLAQQKKEHFILYSGVVVLILLLSVLGLSFASKISKFQIEQINIKGNSITSESALLKIVKREFTGSYANLFSRRNFLIYPEKKIKGQILESFKKVEKVDLDITNFKNLEIEIIERSPDSMWCGSEFNLSATNCYFIDHEGLIYSKAPKFSGNVFLKNFGEISDEKYPIGENFLSPLKYQNLNFFISFLQERGLKPVSTYKLLEGDIEVYLEEGGKIIYNLNQEALLLSEDLTSILKDSSFKKLFTEDQKQLEYIDLRFKNKAYFKFR